MHPEMYMNGEYLEKHPNWHVEDAPYKSAQILQILERNNITPRTVCEVGCGAGEILKLMQEQLDDNCSFWGYDISPQAYELCKPRADEKLQFKLMDFFQEENLFFDVILLIDLIEHVEDYFGFLRKIKPYSKYKVLHIPLDLFVLKILFNGYLLRIRERAGHIHYFSKDLALQVLKDTGYEVLDHFYTSGHKMPPKTWEAYFIRPIRKLLFPFHHDLTARLFGGFHLMILAQ